MNFVRIQQKYSEYSFVSISTELRLIIDISSIIFIQTLEIYDSIQFVKYDDDGVYNVRSWKWERLKYV